MDQPKAERATSAAGDDGALDRMMQVIGALVAARQLDEVVGIVTHAARRIVGADGVTFVLRDGEACFYVEEDAIGPLWKGRRFPITDCISGWCMAHNASVIVPDIEADPRIPHDVYRPTFVESLAMAPVRARQPIGAIGAYWRASHEASPEEMRLLQTMADAAGLAIAYLQLPGHDETAALASELERMRAQAAAAEAERAEEFQALADNIPTLCWMAYADGDIYWYNRRWYEYTGMSPESQAGWGWEAVHDPDVLPEVVRRWRESLDTGTPFEMTFPLRRADGAFRPFLTRIVPIRDGDGLITRWFGANTDITDQVESEARLKLLVNELNHRVKNTLATVQSLAAQTLQAADDPEQAYRALEARLLGISQAHNILTERNWEGAELRDLARRVVGPFVAGNPDRLRIDLPDEHLPPNIAVALALAFNELATNAVKYGALSDARGRVEIAAGHGPMGALVITWTEAGGPPVTTPGRSGFGSRLIERGLRREFGAPAKLEFRPQGLACRIEISPRQLSG